MQKAPARHPDQGRRLTRLTQRCRFYLALGLIFLSGPFCVKAIAANWQTSKALLYQHLGHLYWIADGHGPKILYDFVDPNSRYSHALFEELTPLLARDQITVRQLIVGYLTKSSAGKAAAILESASPLHTLQYGERHYTRAGGSAITPVPVNAASQRILHQDFQVLAMVEGNPWMRLAPLLIYKGPRGRVHIFQSRLSATKLEEIIARIQN
ncbi:MAG: hypothetical protein ACYCXG_06895 [Acidiferrobacter sp.]